MRSHTALLLPEVLIQFRGLHPRLGVGGGRGQKFYACI